MTITGPGGGPHRNGAYADIRDGGLIWARDLALNEGDDVAGGDTGFTVSTTDGDGDVVVLSTNDDRFEIVAGSLRIKANQSFDFESEPIIELTVTGTDQGGLTDTQTVTINVTNVNEEPTVNVERRGHDLRLPRRLGAGDTSFTVSGTDPDAGDSVTLSVSDDRFEIRSDELRESGRELRLRDRTEH